MIVLTCTTDGTIVSDACPTGTAVKAVTVSDAMQNQIDWGESGQYIGFGWSAIIGVYIVGVGFKWLKRGASI